MDCSQARRGETPSDGAQATTAQQIAAAKQAPRQPLIFGWRRNLPFAVDADQMDFLLGRPALVLLAVRCAGGSAIAVDIRDLDLLDAKILAGFRLAIARRLLHLFEFIGRRHVLDQGFVTGFFCIDEHLGRVRRFVQISGRSR
jgi:hypothetical protein